MKAEDLATPLVARVALDNQMLKPSPMLRLALRHLDDAFGEAGDDLVVPFEDIGVRQRPGEALRGDGNLGSRT
jgi:hypothetical protein